MTDAQPIKIAILAMGGEGGGVLADWLVDLAESNGHVAQSTSVPGVAQRTGATIYYVELFPRSNRGAPVLALMPLPGDVDVVIASELMEAGRAMQRGLVTPDRTTLVASTHRVYSITEKTALGDGRVDGETLLAHAGAAAKRFVRFDMASVAEQAGSVISAVLFGALAGTGVLPFDRRQFEATIERGGVGVKASLRAFERGFERAAGPVTDVGDGESVPSPVVGVPDDPVVRALLERVRGDFAAAPRRFLVEGVRRLVDYQDPAYASLYLDRMDAVRLGAGGQHADLITEAARHLALWMSFEDTIRVADLKTRDARFARVGDEVGLRDDQVLSIEEYLHPRLQEICETVPAWLGRRLMRDGWIRRRIEAMTRKGRVVETTSLRGFLMLYVIAGLKRWRRGTLRYQDEQRAIDRWLRRVGDAAATDPLLAVELVKCQRLVKGYSDTHERGATNFATLMAAVERAGASIAPSTVRDLRDAALADEHGLQLEATLQRHALA